eukprot:TRINITY_DN14305_c0_g1_i1.p1 TRINITY_DN14305_c0_g1~~TRINITY_DN14305_c0_g1_i1.p1  ORF type:complete len:313 (-),score=38.31 TRINITY_DN14305_c0_g1_i1:124-1062(-)
MGTCCAKPEVAPEPEPVEEPAPPPSPPPPPPPPPVSHDIDVQCPEEERPFVLEPPVAPAEFDPAVVPPEPRPEPTYVDTTPALKFLYRAGLYTCRGGRDCPAVNLLWHLHSGEPVPCLPVIRPTLPAALAASGPGAFAGYAADGTPYSGGAVPSQAHGGMAVTAPRGGMHGYGGTVSHGDGASAGGFMSQCKGLQFLEEVAREERRVALAARPTGAVVAVFQPPEPEMPRKDAFGMQAPGAHMDAAAAGGAAAGWGWSGTPAPETVHPFSTAVAHAMHGRVYPSALGGLADSGAARDYVGLGILYETSRARG